MGRKLRVEFPGAFYHVYSRGNRKSSIFKDDEDRMHFLVKLSECNQRYGFALYAYTLMHNHFHLLIEMGQIALCRIMQVLLQSHSRFYNRKYGVVGHLFQSRYKAILCDRDMYLLALIRYIHLNCVRAEIVADPKQYRWSSHRAYLGLDDSDLIDPNFVLSQFSKNKNKAIRLYEDFVADWKSGEDFPLIRDSVEQGRILGDDDFVEEVQGKIGSEVQRNISGIRNRTLKEVVRVVEREMNVSIADLQGHRRGHHLNRARSFFVRLCDYYVPAKRKVIAQFLKREPGSLARVARILSQEEFTCLRRRIGW